MDSVGSLGSRKRKWLPRKKNVKNLYYKSRWPSLEGWRPLLETDPDSINLDPEHCKRVPVPTMEVPLFKWLIGFPEIFNEAEF
jgi:hypothetical protein